MNILLIDDFVIEVENRIVSGHHMCLVSCDLWWFVFQCHLDKACRKEINELKILCRCNDKKKLSFEKWKVCKSFKI